MKTFNLKKIAGFFAILAVMMCMTVTNVLACHPGFTWTQTANNTITFTDTTTGLSANATYLWYFGDSQSSMIHNPSHFYTNPGAYYVCLHVIDSANSCNAYFCDSIHVTGCNMTASGYQYHAASCSTCNNGIGHVYATGGTSPYSYSWSPTGQTTQSLYNVTPGLYTCCITDANNCTACTTVHILDSSACNMTISAYQHNPASCSTCANGAGTSGASGGTSPYSYNWSPTGGTNANATGLTPGTYTVCATDAHNCTACTTVTIHDSSVCTLTVGAYQYMWASCSTCADGVGHSYASGGTTPYSYSWSPSGQTTQNLYSATAGTYTVCVTDAHNCTACTVIHITDSVVCNLTISGYQAHNASCSTCADGIGHAFASNGTSPYTYHWSPSGQTTYSATGLMPGTYTVCATDAHSCTACTTVTINDTINCNNLYVGAYEYHPASCATCADGVGHANASGGTSPYSYLWSPSGQTTQSLYSVTPGVYTVCVTDANNCTVCHTVTISDTVFCNITVGAYQYHHASCSTCANGIAHSYATGGTSPYSYVWSPTGGTNAVATGLNPGVYTVCVTDAHSCTACHTVTIGDSSATTGCQAYFYLYPDSNQLHHYFCINYASGTAPFTYNWGWGDATYSSGSNPSHTYANAGVYTICLQITDATGCTSVYCRTDSIIRTKNYMVYVNVISPETGIQPITNNSGWSIYPNPANSTIMFHTELSAMNSQLVIKNVMGQELYSTSITSMDTPIDVSKWSNGVYFYQIKNSSTAIQGKFMKE